MIHVLAPKNTPGSRCGVTEGMETDPEALNRQNHLSAKHNTNSLLTGDKLVTEGILISCYHKKILTLTS